MPKYLTITEARKNLLNLTNKLVDRLIIIIKHDKLVLVMVSYEQMESLLETLEILEDKEFNSLLSTSIEQDKRGNTVSWDDALANLGW